MFSLLAVLFAAAPVTPFKAASAGLTVTGVPLDRAEFYSEYVAQQLASSGLSVVTPRQMATILGLERQRQLMGCTDKSVSCAAEIASALGVDGIVLGEVAKLETGGFQVSLKVVWSRDSRPLTVFSGRSIDEPGLLDVMGKGAQLMAQDLTEGDWVRLTLSPGSHAIVPKSGMRSWFWVPAAVGAVGLGFGTFAMVRSNALASDLRTQTFVSTAEASALAREGSSLQTVGVTLLGVGAAGVVGGALMFLLGAPPDVRATVSFAPGQASIGVAGVFP